MNSVNDVDFWQFNYNKEEILNFLKREDKKAKKYYFCEYIYSSYNNNYQGREFGFSDNLLEILKRKKYLECYGHKLLIIDFETDERIYVFKSTNKRFFYYKGNLCEPDKTKEYCEWKI